MQNEEQKQPVTLDDLATMIKDGFDDIHEKMATKEDLAELRKDFKVDLGELRSGMFDYIGKQNIELKTDLVILMRGEDKKLFSLVELLVEKGLIAKAEANKITKLEPFPQGV